ncbi:hypothetical protein [Xenorhabdus bovienii]|uniref:hypothetical protein n=1 Tax=Xenorhabdus bovienii TaxID=40576 RepID=UPI0023B24C17|nr:hypothetical protein [Xenorhabdus bovienii]MDE9488190.1 hypothetical protein [Xenorhabdus bovienii]
MVMKAIKILEKTIDILSDSDIIDCKQNDLVNELKSASFPVLANMVEEFKIHLYPKKHKCYMLMQHLENLVYLLKEVG